MERLFRLLHIVNLGFVLLTLSMQIFDNGILVEFWLGVYQLSIGIIQLVSLRFFTEKTKSVILIYWCCVALWFLTCIGMASVYPEVKTLFMIIIPMLIACGSVVVSWLALKDILNYKKP